MMRSCEPSIEKIACSDPEKRDQGTPRGRKRFVRFPEAKPKLAPLARLERAAHGLGMDPAQDFQGLHKKTNTW
jgi:hypothetical protein